MQDQVFATASTTIKRRALDVLKLGHFEKVHVFRAFMLCWTLKIPVIVNTIQLKFRDFTVPCIVLTPFHTDDEASWLRNTELHPRWAAPSDLRHLGLKRYPL